MKFHTKASPGLVALGSAAVIAVYAAGLVKTRAAAARFEELPAMRRPAPNPPAIVPATPPVSTAPVRAEARHPGSAPTPAPRPAAKPATPSHPAPAATEASVPPAAASAPPAPKVTSTPEAATSTPSAPPVVAPDAPAVTAPATDATKSVDPPAPPKSLYRDGTYSGWGTSRHGEIEATVVIENGRITSAVISNCQTRYPCSFVAHLPPQVVVRQSADVDYVTGATQSADAFYYAVLQALSKAH